MKKRKLIYYVICIGILSIINCSMVRAVTITNPGLCGKETIYKDEDSIESAIGKSQYLDVELGIKDYCPVYCIEEDTFTWPGFKPKVSSGGKFTWTIGKVDDENILSGLTVKLNGKRNCRTNIDLDKWLKEYTDTITKIETEERTLKKEPISSCINLPDIGSRGCGWKKYDEGNTTTYARKGDSSSLIKLLHESYLASQEFSLHNNDFIVHSNRFIIVYYNPKTVDVLGDTVLTYRWVKYEILCPCEWNGESTATAREAHTTRNIFTAIQATKTNINPLLFEAFERAYSNDCFRTTTGCYNDDFNKSSSAAQTAYTRGTMIEDPIKGKTECNGSAARQKCLNECTSSSPTLYDYCVSRCPKVSCTQIAPEEGYKITSIEQEVCNGNFEEYSYSQLPERCTERCPAGYYFGTDGQCYKSDTTYLERLLEYQRTLIDILAKCTNLSFDFKLDTEMSVDFEEPKYGTIKKLDKTLVSTTNKENHKVYGEGIDRYTGTMCTITSADGNCRKFVTYKICDLTINKNCRTEQQDITEKWIKEYGREYNANYEYEMTNKFYRWVKLPSAISTSVEPSGEYKKYGQFIDVGYANYPVHFNTPGGTYNLDILYKNVGYNNKFFKYINKNVNKSTNTVKYDCEYDVGEGKPYCPGKKCETTGSMNLIYRPISLENPFPAMNGNGRKTGSNWCTLTGDTENCKNNASNETVKKYILNNRNTSGSDIYNKEPMYEIVLNPSLIKKIREYNSGTNYDDYNLVCQGGTVKGKEAGTECRSHFIANNMEESNLPSLYEYFKDTCGMSDDFDACDKLDNIER